MSERVSDSENNPEGVVGRGLLRAQSYARHIRDFLTWPVEVVAETYRTRGLIRAAEVVTIVGPMLVIGPVLGAMNEGAGQALLWGAAGWLYVSTGYLDDQNRSARSVS